MKKIICGLFFLIVILIGLFSFLLTTSSGLYILLRLALPGTFCIHGVTGSVLKTFSIEQLDYKALKFRHITTTIQMLTPFPHARLNISTEEGYSEDPWHLEIQAQGQFPWQWHFVGQLTHHNTTFTARGSIANLQKGKMTLTANPGRYQLNKKVPAMMLKQSALTLILNSTGLSGQGSLELEQQICLKGQFKLPKFSLNKAFNENQALLAQLDLLYAGNKTIRLQGQGHFSKQLTGDMMLLGENIPLIHTGEYQVNVSPKLNLKFQKNQLKVTGTILVPFAHIKPQSLTNSLTLSDDVVFKTKQDMTPHLFNTNLDVHVIMGKQVELNLKGLHAILDGDIHLTQSPQGSIIANGELSVKQGDYKAYGQILKIDQGLLIYTGGALDNPEINLRALKKFNADNFSDSRQRLSMENARIGVEVTGRLTAPKIQLISTPALSQADILSWLILDKPASQINTANNNNAGGQLLLAALSSMKLGSDTNATQLIEQLKQKVGVDVNLQTNTNFNQKTNQFQENSAVVVGKSLSKKLYLSYNLGLSQANPNVLTLKYLLNQFFSIQMSNSSNGSGMDVLYSGTQGEAE